MGHGIERALESIAGWDIFEGADAQDGLGDAPTASCPNCGYTGTMDPPVGIMPKAKKLGPSYAAIAEYYDSYQDLRDAVVNAVSSLEKYAWVVDFGEDWVVYCDDQENYWRAEYSVGDTGSITILNKVEVHRVFVPVAA